MTVAELITELQKMPPDLEVTTEGCDCYGDVGSVEVQPVHQGQPLVALYRSESSR